MHMRHKELGDLKNLEAGNVRSAGLEGKLAGGALSAVDH